MTAPVQLLALLKFFKSGKEGCSGAFEADGTPDFGSKLRVGGLFVPSPCLHPLPQQRAASSNKCEAAAASIPRGELSLILQLNVSEGRRSKYLCCSRASGAVIQEHIAGDCLRSFLKPSSDMLSELRTGLPANGLVCKKCRINLGVLPLCQLQERRAAANVALASHYQLD